MIGYKLYIQRRINTMQHLNPLLFGLTWFVIQQNFAAIQTTVFHLPVSPPET
jgi:hypothetical protein